MANLVLWYLPVLCRSFTRTRNPVFTFGVMTIDA